MPLANNSWIFYLPPKKFFILLSKNGKEATDVMSVSPSSLSVHAPGLRCRIPSGARIRMGNPRPRVWLSPLSRMVAAGDLAPKAEEDPPWHCLSLRLLPPAFAWENPDKGAAVEAFVSTSWCCPAPLCPCGMGTSCRQWEQSRDSHNGTNGSSQNQPQPQGLSGQAGPRAGSCWGAGVGGSPAGHAPSPAPLVPTEPLGSSG